MALVFPLQVFIIFIINILTVITINYSDNQKRFDTHFLINSKSCWGEIPTIVKSLSFLLFRTWNHYAYGSLFHCYVHRNPSALYMRKGGGGGGGSIYGGEGGEGKATILYQCYLFGRCAVNFAHPYSN